MRKIFAVIVITCCYLVGTAFAQDGNDKRWSDAVIVVVHGPPTAVVRARCPAMWKFSKDGATIWVLPTLLDATRYGAWESGCFKRSLKGAKALFIQDEAESIPADYTYLPQGKALKDVVSGPTYQRFVKAAHRVHANPDRYARLNPVWAASPLISDAYILKHLMVGNYPDDLADMARNAKVKVYAVRRLDINIDQRNIRNAVEGDQQEACLNANIDRVNYTLDVLPELIKAWQKSDMPAVLRDYPTDDDDRCSPPGKNFYTEYGRLNMDNWTRTLVGAFDEPGKYVAAIPLPWLLYKGGVLDQMKTLGVTVTPPRGVEE